MFFHQPEALDALATALRRNLIRSSAESPLRVWVPACSTGEDAYSIAIWLSERFEEARAPAHLRIFATDADEGALTAVRRGIYPQGIARQLSDDRLVRFFDRTLRHYRVCASLREKVLAGQHDVLREPPIFSRLDLISCRGVPSDLEPVTMSRFFERLHFSLRDDGYLLFEHGTHVVPPESIFEPVSAGWPIYRKRVAQALPDPVLETLPPAIGRGREERLAGRLLSARQTIAVMTTEIELAHEELRESNTQRVSLNEELAVLNVELQHRVRALNAVNEDLSNLINAIDIVVVFLDPELRIRRFTASAARLLALTLDDIGQPLARIGSKFATAELARSTRETLGVECTFEEVSVRIRDSATASHLFRIAQEAVRNATRHSNADRISIRLAASEGELRLEIRNNGIGLPPRNELRRGVGLKLMEHRCSLLGGRFVAESQPGKGTLIRCLLPSDAGLPA